MRMIKTGVAVALLLGVSVVNAAGLGKLTVNSSLGQVLNAEIDLVSVQPGELESLTARVAPPEAFRDARIEYSSSLRLLRFSVEKRPNGQPYLKVTSVGPINEPFVDALIEVTWPQGRIQREYPILLDPPGYSEARVAPPVTTAAAAPKAAAPAEAPKAAEPSAPATAPAPAPAAAAPGEPASTSASGTPSAQAELRTAPGAAGGDTYGPVQRGDTLRKIAEQTRPSDVSLDHMVVALYRENKSAFVNNNMNRLKTGQILKVPAAEEVSKLPRREVNREIRTHVADWRAYREQLAGGVASLPARPETTSAAAGRIGTAAVAPSAAPSAEPKDVLKLSQTEAGKAAAAGRGGDQARLNALQEELTARDQALREAQSRVADLEKQIRDMQRLLDLKGGVAGKADTKVATAPAPATPAEPVKPADAPKPADTQLADASKPADAAKPAEPPKAAEPPQATDAAKAAPPPPKVATTAPRKAPPPPPKSFTEELLDNPLYLALGGLGLLALGGGALLYMRRRRQAAEYGPVSGMTSTFPSELKMDTTTGKSGGGLVDTGNSSFLTDFDKTGPGTIDTDEVDPVAEAEVYIAYGRDAQAEEILKEAMARDRNRPEIPMKLLEIYHARKSAPAFEAVAKDLRNNVGENHPLWQKAAGMGAQIDPANPLYAAAAAAGAAAFVAPAAPAAPTPDLDIDTSASSAPMPDFNLDTAAPAPALDFDLAPPSAEPAAPAYEPPAAEEPPKEEKPAFDFDLSALDFPGTSKPAPSADATLAAPPSIDLADLNLDTPAADAGGDDEAVGTKLELAKAYLEIGDKDGAREILHEVAKEGSAAQKAEAEKLISSL
jgi:pilus assembly protein FimV